MIKVNHLSKKFGNLEVYNILNNSLKRKQIEFLENHSDFLTEFADVTILIEKILSLILYGSACRSFKLIDAS